jgi:hypothetical protein
MMSDGGTNGEMNGGNTGIANWSKNVENNQTISGKMMTKTLCKSQSKESFFITIFTEVNNMAKITNSEAHISYRNKNLSIRQTQSP